MPHDYPAQRPHKITDGKKSERLKLPEPVWNFSREKELSDASFRFPNLQLELIPPGQPILVDHYSEKATEPISSGPIVILQRRMKHHDKAEYFRRRAAAVE